MIKILAISAFFTFISCSDNSHSAQSSGDSIDSVCEWKADDLFVCDQNKQCEHSKDYLNDLIYNSPDCVLKENDKSKFDERLDGICEREEKEFYLREETVHLPTADGTEGEERKVQTRVYPQLLRGVWNDYVELCPIAKVKRDEYYRESSGIDSPGPPPVEF